MGNQVLIDLHSHSKHSADAKNTVMGMCRAAKEMGLAVYAITDHCEFVSYEWDDTATRIRRSFRDTTVARERLHDCQSNFLILRGVELGSVLENVYEAERLVKMLSFDMIIGSVHNLIGRDDFAFLDYRTENVEELLKDYFDQMYDLCCWGIFDTLGHITYPLRYIVGEHGFTVNLDNYKEQIDKILSYQVQHSKAIEINTSGLRQKYGKTFPELDLVKRFRELGGEYVTIGSDAHCEEDIAKGIEEGIAIAKEAGFDRITYYNNRCPEFIEIV